MRKIVLNINDCTYEKFRFESINEQKNIQQIIYDRLLHKPFNQAVQIAFEKWLDAEVEKLVGGE